MEFQFSEKIEHKIPFHLHNPSQLQKFFFHFRNYKNNLKWWKLLTEHFQVV